MIELSAGVTKYNSNIILIEDMGGGVFGIHRVDAFDHMVFNSVIADDNDMATLLEYCTCDNPNYGLSN